MKLGETYEIKTNIYRRSKFVGKYVRKLQNPPAFEFQLERGTIVIPDATYVKMRIRLLKERSA